MDDLVTRIQNLIPETHQHIKNLQNWGIKKAHAEREYQTALSQKVLQERDKGTAIGVITLTVKGDAEVAKKRLERDVADVMYTVCQEKINISKLEMRILDAQVQREWGVKE